MMILRRKLKLFSDSKKKDKKKKKRNLAYGGIMAASIASSSLGADIMKDAPEHLKSEDTELLKKLEKRIKESGIKLKNKEELDRYIEEEIEKSPKILRNLKKKLANIKGTIQPPQNSYYPGGDFIYTKSKRADTLAHEFGHAQHYKGRDGKVLGKLAHKTAKLPGLSSTTGFISGLDAAQKEETGEEVGLGNKLAPGIASAAHALPTLGKEIAASKRGYRELKNLGASREYLKHSKGTYKKALGTYILAAGIDTGSGYISREVGKKAGKKLIERKKKKAEDKNKDK